MASSPEERTRSAARKETRSRVGTARRDGDGEGEAGASASEDEVALVADDEVASLAEGAISRGGAPSRYGCASNSSKPPFFPFF